MSVYLGSYWLQMGRVAARAIATVVVQQQLPVVLPVFLDVHFDMRHFALADSWRLIDYEGAVSVAVALAVPLPTRRAVAPVNFRIGTGLDQMNEDLRCYAHFCSCHMSSPHPLFS